MVENQAFLFFIFTLNGILIGLLFDFFRILRRSFKTADIVTYMQDVLFWILTGIIILYSIFVFNNGEIRFYMFIGIAIGISLYILLFSQYVIKINVILITTLKKIIAKIIKIVIYPFVFISKLIYRPIRHISNIIQNNIKKLQGKTKNKENKDNKIENKRKKFKLFKIKEGKLEKM